MENAVNHIIELMIAVFSPIITKAIRDWWKAQKRRQKKKPLKRKAKSLKGKQ